MSREDRHETDWRCDSCHRLATTDSSEDGWGWPAGWVTYDLNGGHFDLCRVCYPLVEAGAARVRRAMNRDGEVPVEPDVEAKDQEIARLKALLEAAQLASIEARNPGIDMDEVRASRLGTVWPEPGE